MTRRERVLEALSTHGPMTARELAEHLGDGASVIAVTCSKLKAEGALVKVNAEYALPAQFPKAQRAPAVDVDA